MSSGSDRLHKCLNRTEWEIVQNTLADLADPHSCTEEILEKLKAQDGEAGSVHCLSLDEQIETIRALSLRADEKDLPREVRHQCDRIAAKLDSSHAVYLKPQEDFPLGGDG